MESNRCVICIPVYRSMLEEERLSLQQCLHILGNYPIVFIAPAYLDCSEYETACSLNSVLFEKVVFDDSFFAGIAGYNRLLLSEQFYRSFQYYDYIFIYQLDAYVFRDELKEWCEKGYDYIGAPLFGRFSDTEFHKEKVRVGNGGLSLRRTQAYLDFFNGKKRVFKTKDIANRIAFKKKPYTRWLLWLLMVMGWRNKPNAVAKQWKYNEDDFWSGVLDGTNYALSKPTPKEALCFAFERFPLQCFALTGKLPFGCHAWKKYQYEEFWSNYIRD